MGVKGQVAWNKGKKDCYSEETRKKMSEARKGLIPWNKGKKGLPRKGAPHTDETKEKIRLINIGKKASEETKAKMSLSQQGRKHSEETIAKIKATKAKNPFRWSEEDKQRIGKQSKERAEITKPKRSASMMGKTHSQATRMIMRKNLLAAWSDISFKERMLKAQRKGMAVRPNKPETFLLNILNNIYPGEWKYTGDFSFIINGKNPDFTNINGKKKLIEMYGDYWHKGQNPQDRIDLFKRFGWETLIIWEHELKSEDNVKSMISEFVTRGVCPKQMEVVDMEEKI